MLTILWNLRENISKGKVFLFVFCLFIFLEKDSVKDENKFVELINQIFLWIWEHQ